MHLNRDGTAADTSTAEALAAAQPRAEPGNNGHHLNKRNKQGAAVVHIPPGARLDMLGRQFWVQHVSRTAIVLTVDGIPEGFKQGQQMQIFDGRFTVHKITLPEAHGKPCRVILHPNAKTKINPKKLLRNG